MQAKLRGTVGDLCPLLRASAKLPLMGCVNIIFARPVTGYLAKTDDLECDNFLDDQIT